LDEEDADGVWEAEDFMPEDGSRSATAPDPPVCPICQERLARGTTNQALNDHIDLCLNSEAIEAAGGPTQRKRKPSTVLDWLKKT
jgi:hypothetical protein